MFRKIPSIRALTAFESAARNGSFARAASELCLTESAISRQIAALEQFLGLRLFARVRKQVVLNDEGRMYAKYVAKCLSELEGHTRAIMNKRDGGDTLELAVLPTFAQRWLLPRLNGFYDQHPGIKINLTEKASPFLFSESQCDAALHCDHSTWTGVIKMDLFEERLVPVVNPAHYDAASLTTPQSLLEIPLLYKATRPEAWWHWFELAGCPDYSKAILGMRFDMYSMIIDAARAGLGAGLVPRFYVEKEISRGELAITYDLELCHEKRYCLVYPEHKQDVPAVAIFRNWLLHERSRPLAMQPASAET